jgi:teichoic acid transport system ATP-binding protein
VAEANVAAGERVPTVIVDDAHVIYRVHGSATPGSGTAIASLKRLVTGSA